MKRWICAYGNSQMIEEPTGNYVHIDDHEEALRACEQRVTEEEQRQRDVVYRTGLILGRSEALDSARDAVAALGHVVDCVWSHEEDLPCPHEEALAAIDALRGESDG